MRRALVLLLALPAIAFVSSGCSLQLRAIRVKVEVDNGAMRLLSPSSGRFHGGEVVITVVNFTDAKRQFTLARVSGPQNIPKHVLDAYSYRDDSRVVAVSGVVRPAKVVLAFGALPEPQPTQTTLHIYLHENVTYLLFDRLGGYRHGLALRLRPSGA